MQRLTLCVDAAGLPLDGLIGEIQGLLVSAALEDSRGVKSRAAARLGLKYSTFWEIANRLEGDGNGPSTERAWRSACSVPIGDADEVHVEITDEPDTYHVAVKTKAGEGLWRPTLDAVRRAAIMRAMEQARYNGARAAELVGMKYSTFRSLLHRLEM